VHFVLLVLALHLALVLHELGHLLAALALRLRVRHISLGLGPPLLSWKRGGTRLSLGSLLLGARVEVEGDNPFLPSTEVPEQGARSLHQRPGARLLLALAGPLGSALFAWMLLIGLHLSGTHVPVPLTVGKILHGSAAASAGVQPGDRIESVAGVPARRWKDVNQAVAGHAGATVELTVTRQDAPALLRMSVPASAADAGESALGWSQQYTYEEAGPVAAMGAALVHVGHQLRSVADTASSLLSPPDEVGLRPVVGVRRVVDRSNVSLDAFLRTASLWSLLLMLFHLVPLPPLDAGEALLALIQRRRGRPLPAGLEVGLAVTGFLLLLTLGGLWLRQRLAASHHPPGSAAVQASVDEAPEIPPNPNSEGAAPVASPGADVTTPGLTGAEVAPAAGQGAEGPGADVTGAAGNGSSPGDQRLPSDSVAPAPTR
ncbi:MAG TPA: site-2 protease family protein, partial [Myxococcaceae bacterium]|nr:site-2 protease family protein [Myxococcaceae bacterium]